MQLTDFLQRCKSPVKSGDQWSANCPAHDDRRRSMSIGQGADGRILVKCFAGCTHQNIVQAMGLTVGDLFPESNGHATGKSKRRIVATYSYRDESGNELFQSVRYDPKDFKQRHRDDRCAPILGIGFLARRIKYDAA